MERRRIGLLCLGADGADSRHNDNNFVLLLVRIRVTVASTGTTFYGVVPQTGHQTPGSNPNHPPRRHTPFPHPRAGKEVAYFTATNLIQIGTGEETVCPVGVSRPVFGSIRKTTMVSVS